MPQTSGVAMRRKLSTAKKRRWRSSIPDDDPTASHPSREAANCRLSSFSWGARERVESSVTTQPVATWVARPDKTGDMRRRDAEEARDDEDGDGDAAFRVR